MDLKSTIRSIPDFPKKGILFIDITTLLKDKQAYKELIDRMVDSLKDRGIDLIIGPEARGFVVGAPVAYGIGAGFVPVRKKGKLPGETLSVTYGLEYGTDVLEIHKDAIKPGMKVALVDDLLATGGTAKAVCQLVEQAGGRVAEILFALELTALNGKDVLEGYDVQTIIQF